MDLSDADNVASHMIGRGYDADALHGDMSQAQREKILNKFKKRLLNILVATDVAARGIDVQSLTHVINYSLPQDPESYVHRIGRTGRAGKEGIAITFITPQEYRKLQFIQKGAKTDIRRGRLPRVKDVIKTKKLRIQADLKDIAESRPGSEYLTMSRELLKMNEPEIILAALIQYSFQDELDVKRYAEIEDPVVDTKGKTRLLVKKGRKDGLTSKKLINFIQDKCGITRGKIKDIQLQNKFSFVTLPFHEAEILLSHFRKQKKGHEPFITKVKKSRK
jgi:ATP-dependent RNA helicase DeaD